MEFWRKLARNRLLDVGAAVIAVLCVVRIAAFLPSRVFEWDFNHYYISSRLLLTGQNPYTTPIGPISEQFGFVTSKNLPVAGYPPSFLRLFAPLASLPPRVAFAIWVAGEVLCLGIILWLARQLLGKRLSTRGWLLVCAAAVASQTVYWHFCYSQVQLLLAALVLGAYALHVRRRDNLACLLVSIAGLLKFYPFVLLPWFIWRSAGDWRTKLGRVLLTILFCGVVILATGPDLWMDFFRVGLPMMVNAEVGLNFHYSLSSFVINMGILAVEWPRSPWMVNFWLVTGTVAGFLVIALTYLYCTRAAGDRESEFLLLTLAMLAGNVTVQAHYFVWAIFPIAVAAVRVATDLSMRRVLFFAVTVLLLNSVTPPPPSFLWSHASLWVLINSLPLYGLMGLGFLLGGGSASALAEKSG